MIYCGTESNSNYVFQIEGWSGEDGEDLSFRRTGRPSDCFAKCLLFANSTRNLEECKEEATNSI